MTFSFSFPGKFIITIFFLQSRAGELACPGTQGVPWPSSLSDLLTDLRALNRLSFLLFISPSFFSIISLTISFTILNIFSYTDALISCGKSFIAWFTDDLLAVIWSITSSTTGPIRSSTAHCSAVGCELVPAPGWPIWLSLDVPLSSIAFILLPNPRIFGFSFSGVKIRYYSIKCNVYALWASVMAFL